MRRKLACIPVLLTLLAGCSAEKANQSGGSGSEVISGTSAAAEAASDPTTAPESTTSQDADVTNDTAAAATVESAEPDTFTEELDPVALAEHQLGYTRDVIRENGCIVGVAFVGYIDSEVTEAGIREFLENTETLDVYCYLDSVDIVRHVGAELYALTPLEGYSITVYPSEITEEGENSADRTAPLYEGRPGESILLMCNLSEIYSNVLVSVTDGSETVEFQPMLSMMDGHMVTTDRCQDLSIYEYTWEGFVYYAYESLLSTLEIQDYVSQGMALRCTDEIVNVCGEWQGLVFALGTDHEDNFVNERFYAFGIDDGMKYYLDPMTGEWEILAEG